MVGRGGLDAAEPAAGAVAPGAAGVSEDGRGANGAGDPPIVGRGAATFVEGRTKGVGLVKRARPRIGTRRGFVHGDRFFGPQIAGIALRLRARRPDDPRARGDPDVRGAGHGTRNRDLRGGNAFARFVCAEHFDFEARIPVTALERPRAGQLFAGAGRNFIAGDRVGH